MSYGVFKSKVKALIKESGAKVSAVFRKEYGLYHAKCSDGTTIISNGLSNRVLVKWGSGHQAIATI